MACVSREVLSLSVTAAVAVRNNAAVGGTSAAVTVMALAAGLCLRNRIGAKGIGVWRGR